MSEGKTPTDNAVEVRLAVGVARLAAILGHAKDALELGSADDVLWALAVAIGDRGDARLSQDLHTLAQREVIVGALREHCGGDDDLRDFAGQIATVLVLSQDDTVGLITSTAAQIQSRSRFGLTCTDPIAAARAIVLGWRRGAT